MQIALIRSNWENYNTKTFWFKPESPLSYTAGQFIEMYLPHDNPDERGIKHWFTLSSSPTEELISITTKFFGNKASTFKKTLFNLKPGTEIKIVEPMGDFVLPKDRDIPLVFVAGGIGVTPYRSMVKWLTDTNDKRDIRLLLAANQPKDIVFEDLFLSYGVSVTKIVSTPSNPPPGGWDGEVGQLTASSIINLSNLTDAKRLYVSGPEPMVEALEKDLHALGVKDSQLVLDFFPGYSPNLE